MMGESNFDVPPWSRPVKTIEEFFTLARNLVHFAVRRPLGYFHHYIVAGWENAVQKVTEYYICFTNIIMGPGEVKSKAISEKEIKEAIAGRNLYVVEGPNYPNTEEEREQARKRCWERLGEKAYRLASNNCEHLVSYIMTGISKSEQIINASAWKMFCVDTFDNFGSNFKRNALTSACCLLAVIPAYAFIRGAANEILTVASEAIFWYSPGAAKPVIDKCTLNLCHYACKNSKFSSSKIFASKKCTEVAKASSKEALKKSIAANLIISGVAETCSAGYEIYNLNKRKRKGHVTDGDYDREVKKVVAGAVGATSGTVAGGAIGQAVCPIPVLGYAIGSYVGRGAGRWLASTVAGQIHDA